MEDGIKEIIQFAEFRTVLANQMNILKETMKSKLVIHENGGTFLITPAFIGYVAALMSQSNSNYLLDENNTPIQIEDLKKFNEKVLSHYADVMNAYYTEYQKLRTKRNSQAVVGL